MKVALAAAAAAAAIAVALGVAPGARAASSRQAAPAPRSPTEGTLTVRDGKTLVDVPLRHTDVRIDVAGFLADVEVRQTFANPYDKKIDAVYRFPLPTGAAVNEMEIDVGARVIHGHIDRRAEAKRKYEEARGEGHVAALLTQERPNLFTQSVANLEPGAEVVVRLRYVQALAYEAGGYELVFPMVAGPRYVPPSKVKGDPAAAAAAPAPAPAPQAVLPPGLRSSHDISVEARIDAGVPVTGVSSPSHRLAVDGGRVTLAAGDTVPNKDFILRYRVAGARPELALLAHRAAGAGAGSFFLLAQPPETAAPADIAPREMVFVVDTSSSMAGEPLAKAKEVVRRALAAMGPDDTFQIIRFDDRAGALGDRPLANHPRNVALALGWLEGLAAAGGTEMTAGIGAALGFPHDPARLRIVAFLTDGYVGNEDEVLGLVGARLGASRLYAFGVGSAVNRYLLEEMARIGRGAVDVVRPDEDTRAAATRFHDRIARPLLTDVSIDWGGLDVVDQVPAAVPDLFLGQPLVVSGRYRRAGRATVTVRGRQAGQEVAFGLPVSLPERDEARPAVASVWARARIAELSRREVRAGGSKDREDAAALREQITAIALEHHLMSAYTAFVAVDRSRATAGGPAAEVAVPVEVPEGVRHLGGVGYGAMGTGELAIVGHAYGVGGISVSGTGASGAGYGLALGALAARTVHVPETIPGVAEVRGSLDKTAIKRVFDLHHNEVKFCYERDLQSDHTLAGKLTLALTVAPDGRVTAAEIADSDFGGTTVDSCIVEAARRWTFPAVLAGGVTIVRHPYVFQQAALEGKP
jgi:Ca-activated chloride channel family protein